MVTTTKREGIWIVAEFDGHRGVLARLKGKELNASVKNEIASAKIRMEVLECFDFFCPLRPIILQDQNGKPIVGPDGRPQQGVTRDPLVTGNHFMLEPAPCYVNFALVTKLTFIDDMSPFDQANYSSYIQVARDKVQEQVNAVKAASSPIIMPEFGVEGVRVERDGSIDLGAMTRTP
jgi:hypothetical protein